MPCLQYLKRSGVSGLLSLQGRVVRLAVSGAFALDRDEAGAQRATCLLLMRQLQSERVRVRSCSRGCTANDAPW